MFLSRVGKSVGTPASWCTTDALLYVRRLAEQDSREGLLYSPVREGDARFCRAFFARPPLRRPAKDLRPPPLPLCHPPPPPGACALHASFSCDTGGVISTTSTRVNWSVRTVDTDTCRWDICRTPFSARVYTQIH